MASHATQLAALTTHSQAEVSAALHVQVLHSLLTPSRSSSAFTAAGQPQQFLLTVNAVHRDWLLHPQRHGSHSQVFAAAGRRSACHDCGS